MMHRSVTLSFSCTAMLWSSLFAGAATADDLYGANRIGLEVGGHRGMLLEPTKLAPDGSRPWVWYAPGYPSASNGWMLRQLLARGFYVLGVDVGESYSNPAGRQVYTDFYNHVVREYQLESEARLFAQSRGGLMLYNWAAENPEKVRCLLGIYPVCDLRSYPKLDVAEPAYGITPQELESQLASHNPIERLEPLAKAGIPILHTHGDNDDVVPLAANSQVLLDRYTALGGKMELIVVEGQHHAEVPGFFEDPRLVQFLTNGGFGGEPDEKRREANRSADVVDAADRSEQLRWLFNGKDLTGWTHVNTPPSTWTVRDNMLVCSGKPIGELRTTRMYQNFVLELEWRHMKPAGNAGVFVWADDITAPGVPFHRSIEVQVLDHAYGNGRGHTTHGDIFPIHGATMTPVNGRGGSRAFPSENRSLPSPQWNHYRIVCQEGEISLAVNGRVVTQGVDCSPRKGYICLESEGGVVHYRNIRIREFAATPIDPKHVAIHDRGYRSLYSGVDLSGWELAAGGRDHWQVQDWVLAYDGKARSPHQAIRTEETFQDARFVIDVRLKAESSVVDVEIGGIGIRLARADAGLREHWSKVGGWNRIEGHCEGDRLRLKLNGQLVRDETRAAERSTPSPLRLGATGAADFANIYVGSSTEPLAKGN